MHACTGGVDVFSTHLAWQLHDAALRERQVQALVRFVSECTDPAAPLGPVVAGDFNAEPDSNAVRYLSGSPRSMAPACTSRTPGGWPATVGPGSPGRTGTLTPPSTRSRPAHRLHLQRVSRPGWWGAPGRVPGGGRRTSGRHLAVRSLRAPRRPPALRREEQMTRPSRNATQAQTRERLLDAAERSFAAEGFGVRASIASPRRPGSRAVRCTRTSPTRRTCSSPCSTGASIAATPRWRTRCWPHRDPDAFVGALRSPAWKACGRADAMRQWLMLAR